MISIEASRVILGAVGQSMTDQEIENVRSSVCRMIDTVLDEHFQVTNQELPNVLL